MDYSESLYFNEEYRALTRMAVYLVGLWVFFLYFRKWMDGPRFTQTVICEGKVAIVTSSIAGIGKDVALGLAKRGFRVILTCRDLAKGERTCQHIIAKSGNHNVKCVHLDLGSFVSIRKFATDFRATEQGLDLLINTAVAYSPIQSKTEEGLELQMGVNYYGHALLVMLLLPILRTSRPSRILFVTSGFHRLLSLKGAHSLGPRFAFCQSKTATILGTMALSRRLLHSGVTCNVVDPGISCGDLEKIVGSNRKLSASFKHIMDNVLFKSTRYRAEAVLRAALDFSFQNLNGIYFNDMNFGEPSSQARDKQLQEWFWKKTEDVVGEEFQD